MPAAVLPYDRIAAPLFLACAGHDLTWSSCPYAYATRARHATTRRRTDHPLTATDTVLAYAQAGHGLGDPVPGMAVERGGAAGVTPTANEDAREQLWPRLLAFLATLPA